MESLPLFSTVIERRDPAASRHGGNPQSREAHRRARGQKRFWYVRIILAVRRAGSAGVTAKELAARWGVGLNIFSGRVTELVKMGHVKRLRIVADGPVVTRDGAAVLVYRRF